MGKRFTETEKWKDPWFRKLSPEVKLFWLFLTDNCDSAGFWKKDYDLAAFFCGVEVNESFLSSINAEKERVINYKEHILIIDFIQFQYGTLSPDCKPHKAVIDLLERHNSKGYSKGKDTLTIPLANPCLRVQDKDKDKDKDNNLNNINNNTQDKGGCRGKKDKFDFEKIWGMYPQRIGRKAAERHFYASVQTEQDWQDIQKAVVIYSKSEKVQRGFIQNGSAWFNNWRDWVNHKEPEKQLTDMQKADIIIQKMKESRRATQTE